MKIEGKSKNEINVNGVGMTAYKLKVFFRKDLEVLR